MNTFLERNLNALIQFAEVVLVHKNVLKYAYLKESIFNNYRSYVMKLGNVSTADENYVSGGPRSVKIAQ
jgi:hypothetical protein